MHQRKNSCYTTIHVHYIINWPSFERIEHFIISSYRKQKQIHDTKIQNMHHVYKTYVEYM